MTSVGLSYFNPRSPRGERRVKFKQHIASSSISTLAPREGSDDITGITNNGRHNFNPRSPRGERQSRGCTPSMERGFQPSLPARGATEFWYPRYSVVFISTLAPREGSDLSAKLSILIVSDFNPRSPRGERLQDNGI